MYRIVILICLIFSSCNSDTTSPNSSVNNKELPFSQSNFTQLEISCKIPNTDFSMPIVSNSIIPNSIQSCIISAENNKPFIVIFPVEVSIPNRNKPLVIKGKVCNINSIPPKNKQIYKKYSHKLIVVKSWKYSI